jgi:hypothetical protein
LAKRGACAAPGPYATLPLFPLSGPGVSGAFFLAASSAAAPNGEAGGRGGLGSGDADARVRGQKALQNYVKLHDLVYLWEGTRPFAMRFAQLSPKQCEVVDVRTKRGLRTLVSKLHR